jgi:3-phenylpropionate/trans-cinnamate dioxygenase ferredoxin reductase subunit
LTLRTLADAATLRGRLERMQRVTVIGGGFIGLEFSAVAAKRGIAVTVVEGAPRLMARSVSPATSAQFLAAHQSWGTTVILGQFASRIDGADVVLADGSTIAGDTVIAAAGVVANDELAREAGLPTGDGVIVDAHLSTSDPNISALGDCCRFPVPLSGTPARLESVQAATDHARTIADRLLGQPAPYTAVPWFWSNQADRKLQIAGFAPTIDDWHTIPGPNGKLAVFGYTADALAVVETVNQAGLHIAARKLLATCGRVARTAVEAAGYNLRALCVG